MEKNVKRVDLSIFNILEDYKKLTMLNKEVENVTTMYKEYYEILIKVYNDKKLNKYLLKLKNDDIKENQAIEGEDADEIDKERKKLPASAIDYLIAVNNDLSKELFIIIHDLLLIGTTSQSKQGIREDDSYYVGNNEDNIKHVSYYPLPKIYIEEALNLFLEHYNSNVDKTLFEKVVIPIIYNGLISTLQLFKDGNTRYGRLIQNINVWKNLDGSEIPRTTMPIIYATDQFKIGRFKSRELIRNIAIKGDLESWYDWVLFNIVKTETGLYSETSKLIRRLK